MKHRIREELHGVVTFVGCIWAVFLLDLFLPGEFSNYGLIPRSVSGLVGIVTMPFLHGGWSHLLGNTVPLLVLLTLLAGSRGSSARIVTLLVLSGGALLWLAGRSESVHIGASGLIYGLITFLIVAGFREGRLKALSVAVLVGVLYGATLIGGVLPISTGADVSWDGHLMGAIAGALIAKLEVPSRKR
jgi:membrane associated rhomboid family serine protease